MPVATGADKTLGKRSSYIPALDGLRAIAFFCVFFGHTTGNSISRYIPATFGVTMFFFLSGYLITGLLRGEWQKTGKIALRDFYIRRALRIFIPMYIAVAVALVIDRFFFLSWELNLRGFLSTIFYWYNYARMFQPITLVPHGLDAMWSLSVEEHFYLLFPLFFLFLMRKRVTQSTRIMALLGLCLLGLCWRTYVNFHNFPEQWTYFATDCRFDSILWGSLLALWNNPRFDPPSVFFKRHSGLLAAIAFVVLIGSMFSASSNYRNTLRYTVQGICLYFIFYFAISSIEHWSVRWLENKVLRYIGWLSYSLYLIHLPILYALDPHLPHKDWIRSPLYLALALLYAVAIRYSVELPLQRLRAKFRHAETPISPDVMVEGI